MIDRIAPTRRPVGVRRVMRQEWRGLLFLHWPVPAETIQALLPAGLTVDTFDGQAYVGLVPFTMTGVRPVWSPAVPGLSAFHEINVRTYVHRDGRDPGVWFFSLDAANPVAVAIARLRWQLPYYNAGIQAVRRERAVEYVSQRRAGWGGTPAARSRIHYEPQGTPRPALPGTLEHFLVERYLLYAFGRGRLSRGQVHHAPYPVQGARLDLLDDTLVAAAGISLPETVRRSPIVHYADGVDVDIFPLIHIA